MAKETLLGLALWLLSGQPRNSTGALRNEGEPPDPVSQRWHRIAAGLKYDIR